MTTAPRSPFVRVMAGWVVLGTAASALAQNAPLTGTDGAKPSAPASEGAKAASGKGPDGSAPSAEAVSVSATVLLLKVWSAAT